MKKRLVCMMLVLTTAASMMACGGNSGNGNGAAGTESVASVDGTEASEEGGEEASMPEGYYDTSAEIYDAQLGDFYEAYEKSFEASTVSERYALMAVAEAKLMESAVMLPLTTKGGLYAIGRVAPYTIDYSLWGNDSDRFHQALVCTEMIKSEDRTEMKAKWNELKGTGTYEQWAKDFLAEKGYTLKREYSLGYVSDPKTWDALATSRTADSEAIVNTYDSLYEYDVEGTLQPALADSYEVSEDGLTYTFKLKEGVKWVDYQGKEICDVTANDFVAGMQHMCDAMGGLEYLVDGKIKGISAYINQETSDFTTVGVKAVDDYTLEYTLEEPCTYFMTMLGYGVFAPLCQQYYESVGGTFGSDYDPGEYGTAFDKIAYCGPYLVTNATATNTIVFTKNEAYYNKDNINIDKITWLYNDGSDTTKAYNDAKAGTLDGCNLNSSTLEIAKTDGLFDQFSYVTSTDATSYMGFYNLNREQFANTADKTAVVSTETEEDAARTNAALNNVHFRRAISMGVDRAKYNAQVTGDDLALTSLRNSYTPGNFVSLEEDTKVDINGTETTFPAGTLYGEIMQAQIDADGVAIKVYDPSADEGNGSSDGYDGWYNVEAAKAELATAIEELAADGVTVDAENPIQIDVPYPSSIEVYGKKANAYKQSLEASLDGNVQVNLVDTVSADNWYYAGYYTSYGYEANYDMYDLSGWGPDYGDPSTYLDTFLPEGAGYMIKCIGIY